MNMLLFVRLIFIVHSLLVLHTLAVFASILLNTILYSDLKQHNGIHITRNCSTLYLFLSLDAYVGVTATFTLLVRQMIQHLAAHSSETILCFTTLKHSAYTLQGVPLVMSHMDLDVLVSENYCSICLTLATKAHLYNLAIRDESGCT